MNGSPGPGGTRGHSGRRHDGRGIEGTRIGSEPGRPAIATTAARRDLRAEDVAVIGATEKAGSVGRTILENLVGNPFGGTVFPVNPKRPSVLGIKAYPSIADRAPTESTWPSS